MGRHLLALCLALLPAGALAVDLTGIARVSAGGSHTCALTTGGAVKCWGYNFEQQMGFVGPYAYAAVDHPTLTSGVTVLSSGGGHSCAVTGAGAAVCWGANTYGQLGNGFTSQPSPATVTVSGFASGVAAVSAGDRHSCLLTTGGAVRCWGANWSGQLGNGTTTNSATPVQVQGLTSGVLAIAAGRDFNCALISGNTVRCWGAAYAGQLGNSSSIDSSVPVNVQSLTGVAAITAGSAHACALTSGGGVKCWGNNTAFTPADVPGLTSGVARVDSGENHTCVVTSTGAAKCWGTNARGQLGNLSRASSTSAVDVSGLASGVTWLEGGKDHTCAVTGGTVRCWGDNGFGKLGHDSRYATGMPTQAGSLSAGMASVTTGAGHTCAINASGGVICWGSNVFGELGDGSFASSLTPVTVSSLANVTALSAGSLHTCALTAAGAVKCWGYNSSGALGNGNTTNSNVPVDVVGLSSGVAAIASGDGATCALTTGGAVKCWGSNFAGGLGNGTTNTSSVPVDVVGISSGATSIAAGGSHACAAHAGAAKCWGYNFNGQLGNGSTGSSSVPVQVSGLSSGIALIAAGGQHSCAVTTGGAVSCWGDNGLRQLANGTFTDSSVPVAVTGLESGVAAITAGNGHTCVRTSAGGLKCWGYNTWGQVGNGTATPSIFGYAPLSDVLGLTSGVSSVHTRYDHTCARTTAGAVMCWGYNYDGELGHGTPGFSTAPVTVVLPAAAGAPAFTSAAATTFTVLSPNAFTVAATGAPTPALSRTGALPGGVSFDAVTGSLSGTPASGTVGSYPQTFTATNSAGTTNQTFTLVVAKSNQSITFANPGNRSFSKIPFAPGAVASSALAVTYTSQTPAACSITGTGAVALNTAGTCTITAEQAGNADFNAAAPVTQSFTVTSTVPGPASITSLSRGFSSVTIAFDPPENTGGIAITGYLATCNPGGLTVVTSTSPITITGLTPGVAYTCTIVASNANGAGPAAGPPSGSAALGVTSTALAFGAHAMGTRSAVVPLTVTNTGGASVSITGISLSSQYEATNTCTTLAAGASCIVNVTFVPVVTGAALNAAVAANGTLTITHSAGPAIAVALTGAAEKSLVMHYYRSILNREPDAPGKAFWEGESARMATLGANVNEVWFVMANYFFNSAEYVAAGKTNTAFMIDVYNTFFNRPPDQSGFDFWMSQMAAGLSREGVIFWFMFSNEFRSFTQGIFGNTAARPEVDMVMDLFRGILNRFPETAAFNAYVGTLRQAQCQPQAQRAGAVYTAVNDISFYFLFGSAEYANRARGNTQNVSDMYNAFLRRGGVATEVGFWIDQLNTNAKDRNQLRADFIASAEFGARVNAVIAAGCVQ